MEIERTYVVDEQNHKVAVQIDIKTFERIEQALENYGLIRFIQATEEDEETLDLDQACAYYKALKKAE
jgi:hypothetical protein